MDALLNYLYKLLLRQFYPILFALFLLLLLFVFVAVCCFYLGRSHSHWLLFKYCLKLCSPLRIYCLDGCLLLPKRLMVENTSGIIGRLSDHIQKFASTSCLSTISSFRQMFVNWTNEKRSSAPIENKHISWFILFTLKFSSKFLSLVHCIFASLESQEKQ